MLSNIPDTVSSVFLHTGNMLYYTDVTKQVNMLTTEQVCMIVYFPVTFITIINRNNFVIILQIVEGLKTSISLFESLPTPENDALYLKQAMLINQTEEDRKNLQTMIKVFITTPDLNSLRSALQYSTFESIYFSKNSKTNIYLLFPFPQPSKMSEFRA